MINLEEAIDRIKILECPTGELEDRVVNIFEEYNIANKNEININRDEQLDKDGAQGYRAKIANDTDQSVTILATSGLDDYVAKVVDAYIEK